MIVVLDAQGGRSIFLFLGGCEVVHEHPTDIHLPEVMLRPGEMQSPKFSAENLQFRASTAATWSVDVPATEDAAGTMLPVTCSLLYHFGVRVLCIAMHAQEPFRLLLGSSVGLWTFALIMASFTFPSKLAEPWQNGKTCSGRVAGWLLM